MEYCDEEYREKYFFFSGKHITTIMLGTFIFISGYLLGNKKLDTRHDIIRFYKERFIRFYILYAVSALLMCWMDKIHNVKELLTTLTLTSTFIQPEPLTLWFMSMLAVFYIVSPLIKRGTMTGGGILLILIALHHLIPKGIDNRIFWYYPIYVAGFYLSGHSVERLLSKRNIILTSFILSVIFFVTSLYYWPMGYLLIVPGIVFVLSLSHIVSTMNIGYMVRIVDFIAYGSFCSYLFHRPIYSVLATIFDYVGLVHPLWICISVMMPLCLLLSYLCQKAYDMELGKIVKGV